MNGYHRSRQLGSLGVYGLALLVMWIGPVSAQTFSSGSTGADGALAPTGAVTLAVPADGVFNFTTVNIPVSTVVQFTKNAANTPVTILATEDVTISGAIILDGSSGQTTGTVQRPGGPGGFPGGVAGTGGSGPGGGTGGGCSAGASATYGAPSSFVSLVPLFGGSGGGGAVGVPQQAPSGGGGGGAIVIASSTRITITVNGLIRADGGSAAFFSGNSSGNGSGGAIRLVAPQVVGAGKLFARGGSTGCGVPGGSGRIRIESFTSGFTGPVNPAPSISLAPGPVTAASNPALINVPTLAINSVGGIVGPATPGGSYSSADISLPQGTTDPVPVVLTATNIPVGTSFTVKVIPQFTGITTVATPLSTGSLATSTASVLVDFPTGEVSVVEAFGSFILPTQVASLYPLIDGEPVDRVMVAAAYGGPSTVTLITKSGKQVRADRLNGLLTGQRK